MAPGQADAGVTFLTHLDRRFTEASLSAVAYNSLLNVTSFTMPYTPPPGVSMFAVVRYSAGYDAISPGVSLEVVDQVGASLTVRGDHRTTPLYIGVLYDQSYTLSTIYYRTAPPGGTSRAVTSGRLMLRYITVVYDRSGSFVVAVTPRGGSTYRYEFSPVVVGDSSTPLDSGSVATGTFKVPVMALNDEVDITISSTSYLPFGLLSVDWEGVYEARSRRT